MKEWQDPLVWEASETSSSILPLEFSYPQQSQSTSPAAPITMFNSEESFTTAPSTPEHPGSPAPLDITTESINTFDFPPLPVPPPSMLQVPPFNYHHGQPCHYQHHLEPIYVVGSSSDDSDRSPRSSALSLWITNQWWAQWTPYKQKGQTGGRCGSGLLLEGTHLCWIWNLQTRMGVMLWYQEQVWSYHYRLFFFSAQLCVLPPSFSLVITHSHLLCYL